MNKENIKLTSSEIGTLWQEYIFGTATNIVNKYMVSIVEDKKIKTLFEEAINTSNKQKEQITTFLEKDGFPIPIGFTESDLNKDAKRLFSDKFCLHYLYIMSIHGILGHTTSIGISARKDLRHFYDSANNDGKKMYHQTVELLQEKGLFQRDPYFYPDTNPEFISGSQFLDGSSIGGNKRPLASVEMVSLSLNIKKNIIQKALSIGFSQVVQTKEVRKFLESEQNESDNQIQTLGKILQADDLPVPTSMESEVTNSQEPPFSDKLMLFHIGMLMQVAQSFHGTGLATAMRYDLAATYEKIILKNMKFQKEWFNLMTKNRWFEQPPLAPNRKDIAKDK